MRWPPRAVLPYRPSVGIMVLNQSDKVLIARRTETKPHAWQMPQGGIDKGESPELAALRELKEEIGTNNVTILAKTLTPHKYDFPLPLIGRLWRGKYRGQSQTWFLTRFEGQDEEINVHTEHPEFCEWKWTEIGNLIELAIPFKRELYKAVIEEFRPYLKSMSNT
ncbi:MAG: RNA pyrophosphohydrolase [Alphaproteobacteria bacterium]|nr:RNA pyrophosphohydrolase [Alphaproteobacteria bacterium]